MRETGRGIPDTTMLNEICDVLNISVVELLSGEKLNKSMKSNDVPNVESLLKEKEEIEKRRLWDKYGWGVGTSGLILLIIGIVLMYGGIHFYHILLFFDIPSLMMVLALLLIGLCVSGQLRYFVKSFILLYKNEESEVKAKVEYALFVAICISLLSGVLVTFIQIVIVLANSTEYILRGIAVSMLTSIYGHVVAIILLVIRAVIHVKNN